MATNSFIRVPPDSTGKEVDSSEIDFGGGIERLRQRGNISSPNNVNAHAEVLSALPSAAEYGVVVREAPAALIAVAVSISSAGDHDLIAAVAGQYFEIWKCWLWANDDNTVDLKHGATSFAAPFSVSQGGEFVRGMDKAPWFSGGTNEPFRITLGANAQLVGTLYYRMVTP